MAQLGRIYFVLQDSSGTVQASATVKVCRQGANTAGGGSGTAGPGTIVISVDNPGGIIIGDTINQFRGGAVVVASNYAVTNVTPTTIEVNSGGAIDWLDNDRFVPTGALATIYEEPDGGTTQTNPITTNASGEASTWAFGGFYDLIVSGTGITTKNIPDVTVVGEINKTNVFTEATAVGFAWDTNRDLTTAGAKIISVRRNGTEKFYIDKDGHLGATTFDGTLTVSTGGIAITGNSTITGTLGGLTGLTVVSGGASITGNTVITGTLTGLTGLTVASGSVSLPAGSIQNAALQANIVTTAPTTTLGGIADVTVVTGAAPVDRILTAGYTFTAGNVGALINVNVPYKILCASGDEGTVYVKLFMDTSVGSGVTPNSLTGWTVKAWGIFNNRAQTHTAHTVAFSWFEPVVPTGVIRWKIMDSSTAVSGTPTCSYNGLLTNDGGTARAYIQIVEFKK